MSRSPQDLPSSNRYMDDASGRHAENKPIVGQSAVSVSAWDGRRTASTAVQSRTPVSVCLCKVPDAKPHNQWQLTCQSASLFSALSLSFVLAPHDGSERCPRTLHREIAVLEAVLPVPPLQSSALRRCAPRPGRKPGGAQRCILIQSPLLAIGAGVFLQVSVFPPQCITEPTFCTAGSQCAVKQPESLPRRSTPCTAAS